MTAACVWNDAMAAAGGLEVVIRGDGRSNVQEGSNCYSGLQFNTSGTEYEYNASGSLTNATTWLTKGSSSDVWVMWTRTGGTLGDWDSLGAGNNNVRLNLGTTRSYRLVDTISSGGPSIGAETIIGYERMYDAASGGNLLDTGPTATWSAIRWADACPLCCFTPETLITMARGIDVPIGSVRAGDMILVYNPDTEENESQVVDEVITRVNRPMYRLTFENGTYIDASEDHPFEVKGKGPASVVEITGPIYKHLPRTNRIEVGDVVTGLDRMYTITKIEQIEYPGTVYTFSNYLFYANGKLVY